MEIAPTHPRETRPGGTAAPIARLAPGADAPLSFAQERIWFLDRLGQGGAAYTLSRALRLSGPLCAGTLERALGQVVRRHDALRTTIHEVEGAAVQVVAPFDGFTLPVDDLSALPRDEREERARARATAWAAQVFDLVRGPLFGARLLRLGAEEHVLLLAVHQAVADRWSVGVLLRETWALYHAARDGGPSPLPDPPVRFADFAAWEREQARGPGQAVHVAWWRERLAGAPEVIDLPADHPRPPTPSFRGDRVEVQIPADVAARLRALARAEGATLYMVVLAAFQALLSRHAGTTDVVVGTPVAGRTHPELEGVVGPFSNMLVLRAGLGGDPAFREALARVRHAVLGAWEHRDVPFERLVAELKPERSLSHATIFQVSFQLENADAGEAGGRGVRVENLHTGGGTARLDLALELEAHARGITGTLEYSADLFGRGTARRMVDHLQRVLEQVAADPGRRLSRLELMGRVERTRVLGWNRTTANYPAERCIHQLFEEQAARAPDAVAITFGGAAMTYAELDARANRLANHLAGLGVGPEVRVGICLERGLEVMPAILGVMKAGGAYVPLDRSYPAERLGYMLADSGVRVLLTQGSMVGRIPATPGVRVVWVDEGADAQAIARESSGAPAAAVTSENLAYVIYTSGSTGRPKGVAMHHRGVCNYIHWAVRAYGAGAGKGAPVFTSLAVDLTITNLLPLFAGHPVRFLPEESPVEALAEALRQEPGFGMIKITPTHLSLLTPLLTPEQARTAARTLVIGADFLNAEPTLFWQDHAPGVRLMNEYGPTETVVGCSAYVLPNGKHRAGPVPVGHPIQNIRFYVLDANLEPVPIGLPGELYIAGAGVARGYLGRPALTAGKFLPDPWGGSGERMYRTGDRARWLADGNLLIVGRTDNQVKLRGFRVELGEVDAVLRRHPAVRDCLVTVREDRAGDRRLVAYVVGPSEGVPLREHLSASLPEYMVPSAFVRLESLPQTPTGKIDRKTLPAPEYGGGHGRHETTDPLELELIAMWEELLGVDGIGPTRNFFELGGNSILALRLFARVNRRLGCSLQVSTLFADATVRHLAQAVREQNAAGG
ncbi:MAG TPA: amino acid adenylation domain-containing protein [Longimicrobium sp.]|nr:amino acid adenylation domain-containing protein [Longimicrobium sp.]